MARKSFNYKFPFSEAYYSQGKLGYSETHVGHFWYSQEGERHQPGKEGGGKGRRERESEGWREGERDRIKSIPPIYVCDIILPSFASFCSLLQSSQLEAFAANYEQLYISWYLFN